MNKKKQSLIITIATKFVFVFTLLLLFLPVYMEASYLEREDGIEPHHSAEYVRTLNRHASCEADAAFYNPAGLAFLDTDGLFLMFSNQMFYSNREHTLNYYALDVKGSSPNPVATAHKVTETFKHNMPERYNTETIAPVFPGFYLIWKDTNLKKGANLAAYFSFNVLHATPYSKFKTGFADVEWGLLSMVEGMLETNGSNGFLSFYRNEELIRYEMFLGATAGFTRTFGEYLSLALAVRYINASGKMQVHVSDLTFYVDYGSGPVLTTPDTTMDMDWNLETDTKGHGAGFIGGMHVRPREGMDIGLRYEYYLPLLMKKKTVHFSAPALVENSGQLDIFKDGNKSPDGIKYTSSDSAGQSVLKVTYPQTLACGVSVMLPKNLRVEVSGSAVFRTLLDLDGVEKKFTIGYSAGGSLEWSIQPNFKISAGYIYNNTGIRPIDRTPSDPLLDSHTLGGGFGIKVNDRLDISLGVYNAFFTNFTQYTENYTNVSGPIVHYLEQKYYESEFGIGMGFTVQIL